MAAEALLFSSDATLTKPLQNIAKPNDALRKSAGFHPSIWGDYFLQYSNDNGELNTCAPEVEQLKEEVRKLLNVTADDISEQIDLIDAIQRLGLGYHFEIEIEEATKILHESHASLKKIDDLHTTALYFRLLRQQGHNVSSEIFTKFLDDKGNFNFNIHSDVKGMLSLYEATHLRVHGEDILEEAFAFTITHLTAKMIDLGDTLLGRQVEHALEQPLHRGMPRLEARTYISMYQEERKWCNLLQKLAVLDFNLVQSLHQKELCDLSKWWKDLEFARKLPFARDRLVEGFFWIVGVYFEPHYSFARIFLTKIIALASIIDDIYDVYGTIDELQLFTDAIKRWDASAITQLPDYMKVCYQVLLDVYEETENLLSKEGRSYHVYFAKEAMKDLVRAYFVEAKWLNEEYIPTMEEYMPIALITGAYYMLTTSSFVGMGNIVSKEAFNLVRNDPKLVRAASVICRIMDDVVSHKHEQERGHVASAVQCYMKQYGMTEEQVRDIFQKMVEAAWKDLNEGCLRPTLVPLPLLIRPVNLARMIYVIYKHEDGYTHSTEKLKECITLLFISRVQQP